MLNSGPRRSRSLSSPSKFSSNLRICSNLSSNGRMDHSKRNGDHPKYVLPALSPQLKFRALILEQQAR